MTEPLLIAGGLVIDPSQNIEAVRDILLVDGKVAKVGACKQARVLDAKGLWVVPGLIDMHVHLREPGRESDETIATGTAAAAFGGFTTILAMPNTEPVIDNPSLVRFLQAKAAAEAVVNVLFSGAITIGQKGERLTDFRKLKSEGVCALTDDGRPVMNSEVMRRAMEYAKDNDLLLIDHCEDCNLSAAGAINDGHAATEKGVRGIPRAAETVMVLRDIALCELTGARVHIAHVSAAGSVDAVRAAKKRGLPVSAEAAPHHFSLCDADIPGYDANFKMNPPLRGSQDREGVLEGLADGTIDAIATDHAPHGVGKKSLGLGLAPFGVIGLETSLGLGLTRLVGKKILTRKQLIDRMSAAPARLLGLKSKGGLKPGMDADVTLIDPAKSWKVDAGEFASKSRNSPFVGATLKGRAQTVIVAGRVVHAL